MYELLIIACLAGQPQHCDEFHIPFERSTGMVMCMNEAQFHLSRWTLAMPGWAIKKWTCGLPRA
jgi:hypothetical protein